MGKLSRQQHKFAPCFHMSFGMFPLVSGEEGAPWAGVPLFAGLIGQAGRGS